MIKNSSWMLAGLFGLTSNVAFGDWWDDSTIVYGVAAGWAVGSASSPVSTERSISGIPMGTSLGYVYKKFSMYASIQGGVQHWQSEPASFSTSDLSSSFVTDPGSRNAFDAEALDMRYVNFKATAGYNVWKGLSFLVEYISSEQDWHNKIVAKNPIQVQIYQERIKEEIAFAGFLVGAGYGIPLGNGALSLSASVGQGSGELAIKREVSARNEPDSIEPTEVTQTETDGDLNTISLALKYTHSLTRNSVYSLGIGQTTHYLNWDDDTESELTVPSFSLGWAYLF